MKQKKTKPEKESPYLKYIGQRFDRLVAIKDIGMIRRTEKAKKPTHFFLFKCDCGKEKKIAIPDVLKGKIHSCGCLKHEQNLQNKGRKEGNPKHGDFGKKIYNTYHRMKSECLNKNDSKYENFGGRGIKICDEWLNDYLSFREWSYKNGYGIRNRTTLCRKDLDKDFSPENCFYSTLSFWKKRAMSEASKEKMKKRATAWREENKSEILKYIHKGIITKLNRYGSLATKTRENASWKCGWREIGCIKIYFRSRWEANYARYLQYLKEKNSIKDWIHEPKTFLFPDGKSFLPDFEVINNNGDIEFHEVKGWYDNRSKHHFEAMGKYFPKEKLIMVFSKEYKNIKKSFYDKIEGWEL